MDRNMDSFGPEELSTPELKLIQATGGSEAKEEGAQPGDFYIPLTGEVIKGDQGLDFVVADIIKTRTYWGRSDIQPGEPPACASMNASTMLSINGDDCSQCSYRTEAPWLLSAEERRQKCLPSYNIIAIKADDSRLPILIRASGISSKEVKELFTSLKLNRQINRQYEKALVHVSSDKKISKSGEAYAMAFKLQTVLSDAEAKEMLAITESILGSDVTVLPEGYEQSYPELPETPLPEPEPGPKPKAKTETEPKEKAQPKAKETKKETEPSEPSEPEMPDLDF